MPLLDIVHEPGQSGTLEVKTGVDGIPKDLVAAKTDSADIIVEIPAKITVTPGGATSFGF